MFSDRPFSKTFMATHIVGKTTSRLVRLRCNAIL